MENLGAPRTLIWGLPSPGLDPGSGVFAGWPVPSIPGPRLVLRKPNPSLILKEGFGLKDQVLTPISYF